MIYPKEYITLPIPIHVLNNLSEFDKSEIKILNNMNKEKTSEKHSKEKNSKRKSKQSRLLNNSIFLKGKLNHNLIQLSWEIEKNLNINTYEIKRSIISKKNYETLKKDFKKRAYQDDSIQPGIKYYYIIEAIGNNGDFIRSNEISITTSLNSPENLTATLEEENVLLKWEESKLKNPVTYEVKRSLKTKNNYFSII